MSWNRTELLAALLVSSALAWWAVMILFWWALFSQSPPWWHYAIGAVLTILSTALLAWSRFYPLSDVRWQSQSLVARASTLSARAALAVVKLASGAMPIYSFTRGKQSRQQPGNVDDQLEKPVVSSLSLADLVDSVRPAVVFIQTPIGSGSGFIINEYGTIITNRHVVGDSRILTVRLDDGRHTKGRVSKIHPQADLAIVRITIPHLKSVPLTDAHRVPVGAPVVALGFPLGNTIGPEITVTEGIVSAKRNRQGIQEIQTSAAINPGNSGGPLVDVKTGGVVGVVFAGYDQAPDGRLVEGINFAISINVVKNWLNPL